MNRPWWWMSPKWVMIFSVIVWLVILVLTSWPEWTINDRYTLTWWLFTFVRAIPLVAFIAGWQALQEEKRRRRRPGHREEQ